MSYKAFYRRYRPSSFEEVVGQENIVKTLVNLIKMKKISHGYLFCGPRGTGKTSMAKIFANALNCIHTIELEKTCDNCLQNSNKSIDIIEIDAASNNSVNDIRTIREQVEFAPTNS
ncbi:MAG: AAA family ATPase, partial [Mycoplasmataceae bacterium]|nr:AAA family ATPase [Mycoplasmataceae bacterium]